MPRDFLRLAQVPTAGLRFKRLNASVIPFSLVMENTLCMSGHDIRKGITNNKQKTCFWSDLIDIQQEVWRAKRFTVRFLDMLLEEVHPLVKGRRRVLLFVVLALGFLQQPRAWFMANRMITVLIDSIAESICPAAAGGCDDKHRSCAVPAHSQRARLITRDEATSEALPEA